MSFKKRFLAKYYVFAVKVKTLLYAKKKDKLNMLSFEDVHAYAKNFKKIVVLASGPSAANVMVDSDALYLVTNDSFKLVANKNYIYYVNDGFFLKRLLLKNNISKKAILSVYWDTRNPKHHWGFNFFQTHNVLLGKTNTFYVSDFLKGQATINLNEVVNFFKGDNKSFKIFNSGVFLLLMGYYLSKVNSLPLHIYGLDLGEGGLRHFNKTGVVGKSVTNDKMKNYVGEFLDEIYKAKQIEVTNFSFFKTKQTK